jgi:hypothetical protein
LIGTMRPSAEQVTYRHGTGDCLLPNGYGYACGDTSQETCGVNGTTKSPVYYPKGSTWPSVRSLADQHTHRKARIQVERIITNRVAHVKLHVSPPGPAQILHFPNQGCPAFPSLSGRFSQTKNRHGPIFTQNSFIASQDGLFTAAASVSPDSSHSPPHSSHAMTRPDCEFATNYRH